MRLNKSGNVGIGTTTPTKRLSVNGTIEATLSNPGQIVPKPKGLKVAQNRFFEKSKEYIIRVVFREEKDLRIGITAYKTSKIKKYWRK